MKDILYDAMIWLDKHIGDLICSWLTAALCYFLEIKGAINIMLAIIFADLAFGIAASIWCRKEKFSMEKFFIAVARAFVFTAFVSFLYALDKETHQKLAATYYIATWLISGAYLWSFLKNTDEVFGGKVIKLLQSFVQKTVQEKTGMDISDKEVENGRL